MREKVVDMGVHKPGAEFLSDDHDACVAFDFSESLDKRYTFSYHVKRADFDAALFDNARAAACAPPTAPASPTSHSPPAAARVSPWSGRTAPCTAIAPRYVLDASGRDTFLAGRLRIKDSNKENNTAAVFAHFKGATCRPGKLAGFITVHLVQDGWFWMIPLPGDIMSVGFVGNATAFKGRRGSLRDFLLERMQASRTVAERTRDAEIVGEVTTAGNYSYFARARWGRAT